MDPDKLSDQFIPQTHFPLQTFIGMSKEAAEHLHASGGKDWSKVLDEHEEEYGVRGVHAKVHHPLSIQTGMMAMGKQYGDPLTKELYSAGTTSYRSSLARENISGTDDEDGAVVAVTLHPRNPVRFPESYGGTPALSTPTEGHSGRGWKPVEPSMLPPHDVWEQYNAIPTVNERGKTIDDHSDVEKLFSNRLVITDPSSAMTYIGGVPGGTTAEDEARSRWNQERKAKEVEAEEARKAKRAAAARKTRSAKKNK